MSKAALYYIILALILVGKAGYTLYERSLVVQHGFSVAEYQAEQRKLVAEKIKLSAELSEKLSLAKTRDSNIVAEYAPISKPMIITSQKNLASLR